MEPLRLYKIEAIIVDDQLSKEEVAKRLGSFVIKLDLAEIDPLMGYTKFIDAQPKAKKAKKASKPAAKKITQKRAARLQPQTRERIEQITKVLGKGSMRIDDIADKTGISRDLVAYTVEMGERNRVFAIKMAPNKGTRAVRMVSVIK